MPFEISWEKQGFHIRFFGHITEKELQAKNWGFSNNPRCNSCSYQIVDGSKIESIELSDLEITYLASNDVGMDFYLRNIYVVLVGSHPELKRIYRQYVSTCLKTDMSWKYHICDTVEQARSWLTESKLSKWQDQMAKLKEHRKANS
ncbi:hypothetical protein [Pelagicoccus albus]|uniref:STAS/SEC14 domain-containing protein n=1 Tax=Pelagicoccus albus TaxID=415222 RepID=A0A7X1B6I1_9BACT|nr:hypothetical protein [Pelagicoccus albus]MBC2606593.1 hypothetical protein [Pelagicoccus albus]